MVNHNVDTLVSYWFRHPYARLAVVLLITTLNFLLFREDPTFYSVLDVDIPIVGNVLAFGFLRWPEVHLTVILLRLKNGAWILLKVMMFVAFLVFGVFAGNAFRVYILKDKLRLKVI